MTERATSAPEPLSAVGDRSRATTATPKLRLTSGQLGTTSRGRPGVTATDDVIPI